MDDAAIERLLKDQDGVLSRRQVLDAGGNDVDIERMIRRREWARIHDGVYVDHTGPPSWGQRAWAAVLLHAPAALAGGSALIAHGLAAETSGSGDPIELVVDRSRRVDDPARVHTRQLTDFDAVALLHLSPPRVRVEHAVLSVAAGAHTEDRAVAVLGDAVQQRRTTAGRLLEALRLRPRLHHRALLVTVLSDVASGAFSALERRYLRDVERPHALPRGRRQARAVGARIAYRDVLYDEQLTVVELDGRLGHERSLDRWADLDRDIATLVEQTVTVRASWSQVLEPCRLAIGIAEILTARGWAGGVRRCGPDCAVTPSPDGDRRGDPACGAGDPRLSAA